MKLSEDRRSGSHLQRVHETALTRTVLVALWSKTRLAMIALSWARGTAKRSVRSVLGNRTLSSRQNVVVVFPKAAERGKNEPGSLSSGHR